MFGMAIGFIASVAAVSRGSKLNSDLKNFALWLLSTNPFWFWPLYFLALALVFLVLYTVYRRAPKPVREPLKIPNTIDPYSIAYLRGGNKEVISTAMVELVAAGKIVEYVPPPKQTQRSIFNGIIDTLFDNSNRSERSTVNWIANCDDASSDSTPKIHQIILKHFFAPKGASSVLRNDDVYPAVGSLNEPYEEWVKTEGLRNPQYRESDLFLVLATQQSLVARCRKSYQGYCSSYVGGFPSNAAISVNNRSVLLMLLRCISTSLATPGRLVITPSTPRFISDDMLIGSSTVQT